jgi:reelin
MKSSEQIRILLTDSLLFRFVQYTATIGGESNLDDCFKPYRRDQSVSLQYSIDGGIHWNTLHTLDYASYLKPRRDYIPLPQEARTRSTKIRWWQLISEDTERPPPAWALDDVYIGKSYIEVCI